MYKYVHRLTYLKRANVSKDILFTAKTSFSEHEAASAAAALAAARAAQEGHHHPRPPRRRGQFDGNGAAPPPATTVLTVPLTPACGAAPFEVTLAVVAVVGALLLLARVAPSQVATLFMMDAAPLAPYYTCTYNPPRFARRPNARLQRVFGL